MGATSSRPARPAARADEAIGFSLRTNALGHIIEHDRARFADPTQPRRPSRPPAAERLPAAKPSTRRALGQRLERARGHLHRIVDRVVSLEELATIASLSPFHLARHFKLAFGISPIAYHRILRLERAARLLSNGAMSVAEAAERTGYSDAVALTHAFRKHFGLSPRRWSMRPC